MIVRPATHDDIPRIVDMAQAFYDTTSYPAAYGPMAKESAAGLAIVTMETGVMLVGEVDGAVVAMLCQHVEPFLFNPASPKKMASELVWWIEPEHRGGTLARRMLKAANAACDAMGAVSRMATLDDSPEHAGRLLKLMGYTPEATYYQRAT